MGAATHCKGKEEPAENQVPPRRLALVRVLRRARTGDLVHHLAETPGRVTQPWVTGVKRPSSQTSQRVKYAKIQENLVNSDMRQTHEEGFFVGSSLHLQRS